MAPPTPPQTPPTSRSRPQLDITTKPPSPPPSPGPLSPEDAEDPEPPFLRSCLQCHLSHLKCSYTIYFHTLLVNRSKDPIVSCTRCIRNGEDFCIQRLHKGYDKERTEWDTYDFVADKIVEVKVAGSKRTKKVREEIEMQIVGKNVQRLWEEAEGKKKSPLPRPELWGLKLKYLRDRGGESWRKDAIEVERLKGWAERDRLRRRHSV